MSIGGVQFYAPTLVIHKKEKMEWDYLGIVSIPLF